MIFYILCRVVIRRGTFRVQLKSTVYTRLLTALCTAWVGNLGKRILGFVYKYVWNRKLFMKQGIHSLFAATE